MPTDKKRIAVILDDDLRFRIEEYCMENRINSLAAGVVELVESGVQAERCVDRIPFPSSIPVSPQDILFLSMFRKLSRSSREKVLSYIRRLPVNNDFPAMSDCLSPEIAELILELPRLDSDSLYRIKALAKAELETVAPSHADKKTDAVS